MNTLEKINEDYLTALDNYLLTEECPDCPNVLEFCACEQS